MTVPAHVAQEDIDTNSVASADRSQIDMTVTITAGNAIVVGVGWRDNADTALVSSVTLDPGGANERTLTLADKAHINDDGTTRIHTEAWTLVDSPGVSAVTLRIILNETVVGGDWAVAHEYSGVHSIGAVNNATADSATGTIDLTTTAADSKVVGVLTMRDGDDGPLTPGTDDTERSDAATGTGSNNVLAWVGDTDVAAVGASTVSASNATAGLDAWAMVALELRSQAAAAAGPPPIGGMAGGMQQLSGGMNG